jgi:8-oxo-dGTP pyrophosphatase MutT (NUDIX family)
MGQPPRRRVLHRDAREPGVSDTADVAAAVPYRRSGDALELLIVRTKHGKRWTFPKGHVKAGESKAEAAAREAREEAGVDGEISQEPFTRYRYPDTRHDRGESLVSTFLLAVTAQGEPAKEERRRHPTWVSPNDAVELLAADRAPEYAEEHARVVREALARLRR